MESVLCGADRRAALLRRPGTAGCDHSGGVPHSAVFPLELWGLSLPDAAASVDRGAIFSDLLYLQQGPAAALTEAAPMRPARYTLARCAAAFTGTVMLALLCIVEAAVFYGRMFGWYDWGSLVFPALVTLLPPLVFALGSGWLLGRLKPWLLYVWMAAPVLLAVLPLPEVLGLWDGSFFTAYPLTLEGLDPAFTLPGPMVMAQLLLLAAGAVLLALGERSGAAKQKSSW